MGIVDVTFWERLFEIIFIAGVGVTVHLSVSFAILSRIGSKEEARTIGWFSGIVCVVILLAIYFY